MSDKVFQPVGYEDLTVSTTAVGFTAATRGQADYAHVTVETAAVRLRVSGTPTSTSGRALEVGDSVELFGKGDVADALFISRDGVSATLRCHFGVTK